MENNEENETELTLKNFTSISSEKFTRWIRFKYKFRTILSLMFSNSFIYINVTPYDQERDDIEITRIGIDESATRDILSVFSKAFNDIKAGAVHTDELLNEIGIKKEGEKNGK